MQTNTVAAISTPLGRGGIAVIRISGEDAVKISEKVFFPKSGKALGEYQSSRAVYGTIVQDGTVIDDGIATLFRAPNSFTGEDTVEISCHGGVLLTRKVLEAVFSAGAYPAGAGEFTKRAFINGKMSLSQAEAVIGTINAENEEQLKLSRSHIEGTLTKELSAISDSLVKILSQCYVLCDYPDEDLSSVSSDAMIAVLKENENKLIALSASYKRGHAVSEGIKTVIVGKPNVGKSSLLNTLLGYDRAIVTDIPGTTRDTVEENVYIGNIMLRLCDTAGIRRGSESDKVERIGIDRSIEKLNSAELVIALFDSSDIPTREDYEILALLGKINVPKIAVMSKCDGEARSDLSKDERARFNACINISSRSGEGIDNLKSAISELFYEGEIDYMKTPVLSSAWQKVSVDTALSGIERARKALRCGVPADVVGLDIERAISLLDESDGRKISDEIVKGIFSTFCVGK